MSDKSLNMTRYNHLGSCLGNLRMHPYRFLHIHPYKCFRIPIGKIHHNHQSIHLYRCNHTP